MRTGLNRNGRSTLDTQKYDLRAPLAVIVVSAGCRDRSTLPVYCMACCLTKGERGMVHTAFGVSEG